MDRFMSVTDISIDIEYASLSTIDATAKYLRDRGITEPEVGIVLGSGLNSYADRLKNAIRINYSEIPGFISPTVAGHYGEIIYGDLDGIKVIVLAGRFHYYEGHSITRVVFPYRVLIRLGIKRMIITNASGCINRSFEAGSLMLISDHINLTGRNPLIGANIPELGPRFPDMTDTYNKSLREAVKAEAAAIGIELHEGVYAGLTGPCFETPAEIRFLATIGADAVGMSTVPEAIVTNHAGLEVIGISCLSNMAAGIIEDKEITTDEVDQTGADVAETFAKVVDIAVRI